MGHGRFGRVSVNNVVMQPYFLWIRWVVYRLALMYHSHHDWESLRCGVRFKWLEIFVSVDKRLGALIVILKRLIHVVDRLFCWKKRTKMWSQNPIVLELKRGEKKMVHSNVSRKTFLPRILSGCFDWW